MAIKTDDYKKDIQVGISTLVASLGFYKAQELIDFIRSIKRVGFEHETDYFDVLFAFFGFVLYVGYLLCVAFSLYCIYRNRPKGHQQSILFAVSCYFALQVILIILVWNEKAPLIEPDNTHSSAIKQSAEENNIDTFQNVTPLPLSIDSTTQPANNSIHPNNTDASQMDK